MLGTNVINSANCTLLMDQWIWMRVFWGFCSRISLLWFDLSAADDAPEAEECWEAISCAVWCLAFRSRRKQWCDDGARNWPRQPLFDIRKQLIFLQIFHKCWFSHERKKRFFWLQFPRCHLRVFENRNWVWFATFLYDLAKGIILNMDLVLLKSVSIFLGRVRL